MTSIASTGPLSSRSPADGARPTYAHAHWYLLAAFVVVIAGFWPSFFRPMTGGTTLRTVHGVTSSLWYVALILQPWLVNHGYVRWHRRVAVLVITLLPILCITALMTTRVMLAGSPLPVFIRPLIAWLDVSITGLFVAQFLLGLKNRRTPAAHKRYMASTALFGFPPAVTRFVGRMLPTLNPLAAINLSFLLVELVLVVLIVADWRAGERRRWAYPIALAGYVGTQALMFVVPGTSWWLAFCQWFAA